jgi:hypothetical protein
MSPFVEGHDKFTPIPVGINCNEHFDALKTTELYFKQKYWRREEVIRTIEESLCFAKNIPCETTEIISNYNAMDPILKFPPVFNKDTTKLMLVNFDESTDPSGTRSFLKEKACNLQSSFQDWKNISFCLDKEKGVSSYISRLSEIYKSNMNLLFWLSPRGGGVDCHRTWEALYLGRIPILQSSELDPLFHDLPVYIVKSYKEINEKRLVEVFIEITEKRKRNVYNFRKLQSSYWEEFILSYSKYNISEKKPGRCWQPA